MRVWELAEELRILSKDVLELIEPYDRYIRSHLAAVPRQALDAIRAAPPAPRWGAGEYYDWHRRPKDPWPVIAPPAPALGAAKPGSRTEPRHRRRRPGPKQISFEPALEVYDDGYTNDPTADLRYEPVWSTRDVATYLGVKSATVRQWVARGYLTSIGKEGPSHVFERDEVLSAADAIAGRRRLAGVPAAAREVSQAQRRPDGSSMQRARPPASDYYANDVDIAGIGARRLHRLSVVTPDSLVTTAEAATLLGLSTSTLRSWVRRGIASPVHGSNKPPTKGHLFKIKDLYRLASRT